MSSPTQQQDKEAPDRLGRELRSLPRVPAPWDFEARLRQRIWGIRKPDRAPGFFRFPSPAYAVPAVAMVLLAVVGYLQFGGEPSVAPVLQQQSKSVSPGAQPARRVPPRTPESLRGTSFPAGERTVSGPSAPDAAVRVPAAPSRVRDSAVVSALRKRLADTLTSAPTRADSSRRRRTP